MRISQAVMAALLTLLPRAGVNAPESQPARATVLRDVRIVDGTGAPPREHQTVVLANGRIQAICAPQSPCAVPPGSVEPKEAKGATVLPGLITAHAHLALLNGQGKFDAAQYTAANVVAQLALYQQYGVTTMVSLGANRDLVWAIRADQRAGKVGGARLLTVGRGIGVPGGFPPFAAAPDQLDRPATPDEARAAVDRAAEHHADLIKIWMDSNHGKLPEMSDAIATAVLSEAHRKGLRVAAHVYALEDARRLVNEGIDILAHSVRDKPVDASFVALLKAKGTWYLPTLTVDESFFAFADHPELLDDPRLQAAVPASQVAILRSEDYRRKVMADPATAQHRADFAMASRNLKTLYDAGVHVGFGTDSGAALGRIPGYAEHRELLLMVRAGLTPLQALGCATAHNAALLRLDAGVLRKGATADLLVVRGDPAVDINAVNNIAAVYQAGEPVSLQR